MTDHQSKVAVLGAGVIGQVYAGRLADSGHQVWLLARGATFTALSTHGVRLRSGGVSSTLRLIFTVVPKLIAIPYWQKQMRGDLGRLTLAPHVIATRGTEFRQLAAAARQLTQNSPHLDAALTAAGFPSEPKHPLQSR